MTLAPAQPVPAELLRGLDPLLVNEHEAAFLLGTATIGDPLAAAAELLRLGPAAAVITLGPAGAAVADGSGTRLLAAVPVATVIDTTGAGDAFAGALAAALSGRRRPRHRRPRRLRQAPTRFSAPAPGNLLAKNAGNTVNEIAPRRERQIAERRR